MAEQIQKLTTRVKSQAGEEFEASVMAEPQKMERGRDGWSSGP